MVTLLGTATCLTIFATGKAVQQQSQSVQAAPQSIPPMSQHMGWAHPVMTDKRSGHPSNQ